MATTGSTMRDRDPRRDRAGDRVGELPASPTPADLGAAVAPQPPPASLGPGLRAGLVALRGMAYLLVAMVVFAFVVHLVR